MVESYNLIRPRGLEDLKKVEVVRDNQKSNPFFQYNPTKEKLGKEIESVLSKQRPI